MSYYARSQGMLRITDTVRFTTAIVGIAVSSADYNDLSALSARDRAEGALDALGFQAPNICMVGARHLDSDNFWEVDLDYSDKYRDDNMRPIMAAIAPFVSESTIYFVGENGDSWKFEFDGKGGVAQYERTEYTLAWNTPVETQTNPR